MTVAGPQIPCDPDPVLTLCAEINGDTPSVCYIMDEPDAVSPSLPNPLKNEMTPMDKRLPRRYLSRLKHFKGASSQALVSRSDRRCLGAMSETETSNFEYGIPREFSPNVELLFRQTLRRAPNYPHPNPRGINRRHQHSSWRRRTLASQKVEI